MEKKANLEKSIRLAITIRGMLYYLTISGGNNKMSNVPSISVMPGPGVTCPLGVPCWNDGCYAKEMVNGAYGKAITRSWSNNMKTISEVDPEILAGRIAAVIKRRGWNMFRWNVGGDFALRNYFRLACLVAEKCPDVVFYAYTKVYGVANLPRPLNFNLVFSAWNEYTPDNNKCGIVYMDDGKHQIPADAYKCAGNCEKCRVCSLLRPGESVVIKKHGRKK